ncbi:hypothetical protein SAMN02990966_03343 [Rhodospirillales bacterium URHD0017]|nr:hypothetical protein SAMN02990966_03343 [Rhodospirillales bacterium URHD0017]
MRSPESRGTCRRTPPSIRESTVTSDAPSCGGFPTDFFHVVDGDEVTVLGCFHLHRDPHSQAELRIR